MTGTIEKWLEDVAETVAPTSPASVHLDELTGWGKRTSSTDFAFVCFFRLWTAVELAGLSHRCVLVWPLDSTEGLAVEPPTDLVCAHESPSLYLVHPDAQLLPDLDEEYRLPIEPEQLGVPFDQGYAYYRCFRVPEAIRNSWEYERAVYFVRLREDPDLRIPTQSK